MNFEQAVACKNFDKNVLQQFQYNSVQVDGDFSATLPSQSPRG